MVKLPGITEEYVYLLAGESPEGKRHYWAFYFREDFEKWCGEHRDWRLWEPDSLPNDLEAIEILALENADYSEMGWENIDEDEMLSADFVHESIASHLNAPGSSNAESR